MVVPSAFAANLGGFGEIAKAFGANELKPENGQQVNQYVQFIQDDCTIFFEMDGDDVKTISIDGKGDAFIAYCCAAFFLIDPKGDTTANYGQFITAYLLAHTTSDKYTYGKTSNGLPFGIKPENGIFSFVVMK